MINVVEYVKSTNKHFRQKHLNLTDACLERGGNSSTYKGVLAQYLGTDIPEGPKGAYLLHACHNSKCSNPLHLYWGTPKENVQDSINNGAHYLNGRKPGYRQTDAVKQKISSALRGRKSNNSTGFNGNGTRGMKFVRKHKKMWINNGIAETTINVDDSMPEGFTKGRL